MGREAILVGLDDRRAEAVRRLLAGPGHAQGLDQVEQAGGGVIAELGHAGRAAHAVLQGHGHRRGPAGDAVAAASVAEGGGPGALGDRVEPVVDRIEGEDIRGLHQAGDAGGDGGIVAGAGVDQERLALLADPAPVPVTGIGSVAALLLDPLAADRVRQDQGRPTQAGGAHVGVQDRGRGDIPEGAGQRPLQVGAGVPLVQVGLLERPAVRDPGPVMGRVGDGLGVDQPRRVAEVGQVEALVQLGLVGGRTGERDQGRRTQAGRRRPAQVGLGQGRARILADLGHLVLQAGQGLHLGLEGGVVAGHALGAVVGGLHEPVQGRRAVRVGDQVVVGGRKPGVHVRQVRLGHLAGVGGGPGGGGARGRGVRVGHRGHAPGVVRQVRAAGEVGAKVAVGVARGLGQVPEIRVLAPGEGQAPARQGHRGQDVGVALALGGGGVAEADGLAGPEVGDRIGRHVEGRVGVRGPAARGGRPEQAQAGHLEGGLGAGPGVGHGHGRGGGRAAGILDRHRDPLAGVGAPVQVAPPDAVAAVVAGVLGEPDGVALAVADRGQPEDAPLEEAHATGEIVVAQVDHPGDLRPDVGVFVGLLAPDHQQPDRDARAQGRGGHAVAVRLDDGDAGGPVVDALGRQAEDQFALLADPDELVVLPGPGTAGGVDLLGYVPAAGVEAEIAGHRRGVHGMDGASGHRQRVHVAGEVGQVRVDDRLEGAGIAVGSGEVGVAVLVVHGAQGSPGVGVVLLVIGEDEPEMAGIEAHPAVAGGLQVRGVEEVVVADRVLGLAGDQGGPAAPEGGHPFQAPGADAGAQGDGDAQGSGGRFHLGHAVPGGRALAAVEADLAETRLVALGRGRQAEGQKHRHAGKGFDRLHGRPH